MYGELTAITEPGRRFVALAEEHAADFATRAAEHDRDGTFPTENFEAMQQSGFLAAPVPEEFGGLGLFSIHDMGIGLSRLARGDGSCAIAANMHLTSVWTMHRLLRMVHAGADGPPPAILEGLLKGIAARAIVVAVPATEAGTTVRYPKTEVVPAPGGGYVLNGHKIFGTLSPFATLFFSSARLADGDGGYESVLCMLGRDTEGVEVKDNWDAIGMRASGSNDVIYRDVRIGEGNVVRSGQPLGGMVLGGGDPGGTHGLLGAFLGIAEAAAEIVIEQAKTRRKSPSDKLMAERQWMQHLIGEMDIDLTTCRGLLAYEGRAIDEMVKRYPKRDAPEHETLDMERLHQSVKYTINRRAIEAVDKALTASGGAGYMSKHPLARLYRDVRAGPFMQPFSPPEGIEYIGRVVLGQDPNVDL